MPSLQRQPTNQTYSDKANFVFLPKIKCEHQLCITEANTKRTIGENFPEKKFQKLFCKENFFLDRVGGAREENTNMSLFYILEN